MHPIFKTILFGLSVFVVFNTIAVILKLVTKQFPIDGAYFGLFTNNDILLGLVVSIFVTFSHERKKRLK